MSCGLSQQELSDFGIPIVDGRCQGQATGGSLCGDLISQHSVATKKLKALVIGPAEAGTSTLFKQITVIYGDGIAKDQRIMFLPIIVNNIVTSLRALVREADLHTRAQFPESWDFIVKDIETINSSNVHHFLQIWKDPAIQVVQSRCLHANLAYFMERLSAITAANFVPSTEDYWWMHCPTRGLIYEREFAFSSDTQCKVMYLGSSRSESSFRYDVNVVMFVANLATCHKSTELTQDLEFFERVCNARSMVTASICLLLNKNDLFQTVLSRDSSKELELHKIHEKYAAKDHRPWDGTLLDSTFFPFRMSRTILHTISAYMGRFLPIYYTSLTDANQARFTLDKCMKTVSL